MQTHNQLRHCRVRSEAAHMASRDNVNFLAFCLSGLISIIVDILFKLSPAWISSRIKWCPTSSDELETTENGILSSVQRPYKAKFMNIGPCWEKEDQRVRTLKIGPFVDSSKTPLVLLHGFATGMGMWVANLDRFAETYPVYAFDMLGFGRSSRPKFSSDPAEAEQQFVMSIEMWRRAVGLERMILLGHDMGGFLATSYAIQHPERVERLVLVDPWGFPEKRISNSHKYEMPNWIRFLMTFTSNFNLLAFLRASGPLGPYLTDIFRRDLQRKFKEHLKNKNLITKYIYHCNAQLPSGEVGFKAMADHSGWPIHPMINRIPNLLVQIPMDFIYGSRSWINRQPALQIRYSRLTSHVGIEVLDSAGHHVYVDQPEQFNNLVLTICDENS